VEGASVAPVNTKGTPADRTVTQAGQVLGEMLLQERYIGLSEGGC